MRRILVTGAATWTGSRLIQMLEQREDVLVVAVDELRPRLEFTSAYHELSLDRPALAEFLIDFGPDTVVHLQTVDRAAELGRSRAHEEAVVGAQALFGAIGKAGTVRHVVVKSDAAFYGTGARNPSLFSESTVPYGRRGRYARELETMEQHVHQMNRAHQTITYSVLRFASIIGPRVGNPISRFLALPAVPTILGFDPRLQFVYEEDAVAVIYGVVDKPVPGTFNVAAAGQMYLSRVIRLGGRVQIPLPKRAFDRAVRSLTRVGVVVPGHLSSLLKHGRVLDVSRMSHDLGVLPSFTCRQSVLAAYGRLPQATPAPR